MPFTVEPRYKVEMPRFVGAASVVVLLIAWGCRSSADRPSRALASGALASSTALASLDAGAAPDAAVDHATGDASADVAADPPATPGDAGAECAVIAAARQLSFTGPMELSFADGAPPGEPPQAIFNQDGGVRIARLAPLPTKAAKGAPPPDAGVELQAETATSPGCAIAGGDAFCLARSGSLLRSRITGEDARVVATARPGSSLAAAAIDGGHVVVAFLVDARTTEGVVLQAYVKLDDAPPVRLSEDGSGATFVTLAAWRGGVLAVYIDERRALSPVHARFLTVRPDAAPARALDLGRDAVVFVGDGGNGRMTGAIATSGSDAFGLVATARSDAEFGLAAIRIDTPPRDDAPTSWSAYPRSALTVPVDATRGRGQIHALRSRPASTDANGRYALEVGRLDGTGAFRPVCVVAEGASFSDPRIAVDGDGSLWLAYTTGGKSWLERRATEPRR